MYKRQTLLYGCENWILRKLGKTHFEATTVSTWWKMTRYNFLKERKLQVLKGSEEENKFSTGNGIWEHYIYKL